MGSPSLGLRMGLMHFGNADLPSAGGLAGAAGFNRIPSRNNFKMVLPFNFGGKGVGFDLHPGIAFGDATTVSVYLGLAFEIHLTRAMYFGFGLGPELGYWLDDAVDVGIDAYFRVPLRFHYYLLDQLGLFAELGLGYGGTGVKYLGVSDLRFGSTMSIEFSVGVRFP